MASYLTKMKTKTKHTKKGFIIKIVIGFGILILIIISLVSYYLIKFNNRIYPGLSIAGINIGGSSKEEAYLLLSKTLSPPSEIVLTYQDQVYKIKPSDAEFSYDFSLSVLSAYKFARTGDIISDFKNRFILVSGQQKDIALVTSYNNEKFNKIVSIISGQISVDPIKPTAKKINEDLVIERGSPGKEVNQKELQEMILKNVSFNSTKEISIPVDTIDNTLNDEEVQNFRSRLEKFVNKNVSLNFEYTSIILQDIDIFKLLDPKGGYNNGAISEIIQKIVLKIERSAQNPKFVFENGKVIEFQPALDGIRVDINELENLIIENLNNLFKSEEKGISISIPVVKTSPDITTDKVNNLGIKEIIGRGSSTYYHSIPGRVHNVALAASRMNGTLVAPGETFSFNQSLGDVSAFTGYQQAYIISEGKTILGDGGGVCQVSTTLFRAVLNAGLPIVERQAHAYRVGYYEQGSPPGLDATVYSPSPDFKFVNDTSEYILIEATADTKNYSLIFELYGTKDGRAATVSKPVVTNVSTPPEDRYQDDPTLPLGTIKQIEHKAWGAKVTFNYKVIKDGRETINKTFISNYKPWQAVYLKGTGPAN